jgi:hypothetical protein
MTSLSIGNLPLSIALPGRAGQLQAMGAAASLISELASNYDAYHAFLAQRLAALGPRPTNVSHPQSADYFQAWAEIENVVRCELILRACWDALNRRRTLDSPMNPDHGPAVGPNDQLLASQVIVAAQPSTP